jgi:hypothetical protein
MCAMRWQLLAAAAVFFILLERRANRRCADRNKSGQYSASSSYRAPPAPAAELDRHHLQRSSGVRGGAADLQEQVMAKA